MLLKMKNDFHGTEAVVRVKGNRLTVRQLNRLREQLCGIEGCTCGGYAGERGRQRYLLDYEYNSQFKVVVLS